MSPGTRNSIIIASGIVTAVITAFLTVGLDDLLHVYFFSLMGGYVPAGAILIGAAGASGFFWSAYRLDYMPTKSLFYLMLLVSCLTLFLIYFIDYSTSTASDGTAVGQSLSFFAFLNILLSNADLRLGTDFHEIPLDVEVAAGKAGYVLAVFQLAGVFIGGWMVFWFLRDKPICQSCRSYLRLAGRRTKFFTDNASFQNYYEHIFEIPVTSPEFTEALSLQTGSRDMFNRRKPGMIRLNQELKFCRHCGYQVIQDYVSVWEEKELKRVGALSRRTEVPPNVALQDIFSTRQDEGAPTSGARNASP